MNFEILRIALAVGGTALAARQDAKTSYIDDNLLYAMIAAGAVLDLLTFDADFIFSSFAIFAVIMFAGYFAFRSGQFGAGDAYLLAGIHLLIPVHPSIIPAAVPSYFLFFPPVLSAFIAASFLAVLGSAAGYACLLKRKLRSWKATLLFALAAGIAGAAFGAGASILLSVFLTVFLSASLFLLIYKDEIMHGLVVTRVPLSKVEDEDVLAVDKLPARFVARWRIGKVATKEVMARLRRSGVASVWVHKNLPRFGPYVLFGLLATLLAGDPVAFVLLH
ncbi:MAG: prepilin peptidase [Candidatus Micrarchaeia archaeon]